MRFLTPLWARHWRGEEGERVCIKLRRLRLDVSASRSLRREGGMKLRRLRLDVSASRSLGREGYEIKKASS